ncbi:hypothetical protein GCM10027063_04970 [Promicromonospora xylanilytica]
MAEMLGDHGVNAARPLGGGSGQVVVTGAADAGDWATDTGGARGAVLGERCSGAANGKLDVDCSCLPVRTAIQTPIKPRTGAEPQLDGDL